MSSIVFDQFQRYRLIERLVRTISAQEIKSVLEVGAHRSPLRDLLKDRPVVLLDRQTDNDLDLRADALQLPFPDRAFDIVISTDVVEHMKASDRISCLHELHRVTSEILIVGFPHMDAKNTEADRIFFDFIQSYSQLDVQYLKEHLEYGLPEANEIRTQLQSLMPHVLEFPNSNVQSWLLLQLANFTLLQQPELEKVRESMNRFFNEALEPASHDPPCYRTFFVCSRERFPKQLLHELEAIRTSSEVARTDYSSRLFALVDAAETAIQQQKNEKSQVKQILADLQERFHKQEEEKTYQETEVQSLKIDLQRQMQVIQNLHEYLNLFLQHPAYRLYKKVKTSLHHLFGITNKPAQDLAYMIFQKTCEPDAEELGRQSREWQTLAVQPVLNLVTAVFKPPLNILQATIDSVRKQTYGNWTWNIVDASQDERTWNLLREYADQDHRIKPHRIAENQGISANMNVALQQATGDYIVILDHDDTLAPHALFSVATAISDQPDLDFIYSDADKLDERGNRCEPLFKPNFSPDMMLCCNLLNQISVFRRTLLNDIGYLDPALDGAQDWDLYLRIMERTTRIHHIPKILYHWRKTPESCAQSPENKPYAARAQRQAVKNHLTRIGRRNPQVGDNTSNAVHRVHPMSSWEISNERTVSVIIPTRDHAEILNRCLYGLLQMTIYKKIEVILVDTESKEEKTFELYKTFAADSRVKIVHNGAPFNFARACNAGAEKSTGSLLLFLNNDIEVLHEDWLRSMVQWFEWPEIGVVGPKLLYANGKIQHAGIIVGLGGLAGHLFLGEQEHRGSIFGSDDWYRNVSAVTGACLLVRREAFEKANGFDEAFLMNFSDVDLCLKIRQLGYRIVYTPQSRLIHHESVTHGRVLPRRDFEQANIRLKPWLTSGDPYFNPNLSYRDPVPLFRNNPEDSCESTNQVLMRYMPKTETIRLPLQLPQKRMGLFATLRS